ncbi:MAG TPA: ABC transporter substrate-binding protein, partial [Xenococcaceae cyanobacterium]
MKKFNAIVAIGLILGMLLGCNASESDDSAELEFWTMQLAPQFNDYFAKLNGNFESANQELQVRWIDIPWSAMESKILTAISAKTAPDLVNLNPNFASQLASRNAWLDLDEVIPSETKAIYLPNIWQASSIEVCQEEQCEQDTFGIPWYLTTRITIYNQQLLQQAGITQPPGTYGDLKAVAQQVKSRTGKYAFFITFVPGDSGEVLESMVQMGVSLLDEQGKAAFDTPEGVAAFRYWVEMYQQQLLPPEVLTQGHRYGVELYQAGETALLASG